jgi:branched-chain amino acid aminotransferase
MAQPLFFESNRAFRYGDALFETIKCHNGQPLFIQEHMRRLKRSMKLLSYQQNDLIDANTISNETERMLRRNRWMEGARLRLAVYRIDGGLYTPESNQVNVLLSAEENVEGYPLHPRGYDIEIFTEMPKPSGQLSSVKSANSLFYIMAANRRVKEEKDELILTDDNGNLLEGVSSNLFLIIDNEMYTPPTSQPILPGIMRGLVIKMAKKSGIRVNEVPLRLSHLEAANEVFFTNTIQGAIWVRAFRQKRYFHRISDQINAFLNQSIGLKSVLTE